MGFTLEITNAPAGATLWNANFAEKSFDYTPMADSGWLAIDESWVYPSDPRGCTSLHIWILDANNNILLNVYNLGPVNDAKEYIYDYSTRRLSEVPPEEEPPPEDTGPYASISITAPSSAEEGESVSVSVRVTNITQYHYSFRGDIYAVPDRYSDYVIGSIDQVITSGSSVTRNVSFTMPDCNVTVFIWLERWARDHWAYVDSASKIISLEVVPVPTTFHLSILVPSWAAGGYVEPGSGDYPGNTTITLRAYPLSGYQFTSWGRDASGTSTTYNLYMNSDKNVEAYFEKMPVPEYKGTIIRKELEYDESRKAIPVY